MRLKTKLVAAITGLVFLVVTVFSWIYLRNLLQQHIEQSYSSTDIVAHQVLFQVRQALEIGLKYHPVDPSDPVAVRAAVAASLREDPGLNALLSSDINYSPTIFDISVADGNGRALISAPDPSQDDQLLPQRPDYAVLLKKSMVQTLRIVFGRPRVYNVSLGLERNNQPFVTVRVGIRTTFLQNAFHPWLFQSFTFIGLAILTTLIVSAFVANLALKPIELISRRLDTFSSQSPSGPENAADTELEPSRDAVAQVSGKIERLGRRMRNVEEVFSALKENLDQILSNLQDGMMLFTRDARAVLVSSSVERFLNIHRDSILGADAREIFDRSTRLGRTIRDAFDAGMSIVQEEVMTETGRRIEVSMDFIHDDRSQDRHSLGALLTLHDLESVREIESELEVSRRMAAIGRLTAGVGHEVKNPINAIVVHLELLRNKIAQESGAIRHLDVIQSEISRLDRVVQTLVDFSRPVELQLRVQDLRVIVSSVLLLASADLETRQVRVSSHLPEHPVNVRVDADLLKQALLNVVLNGAQAMAGGGTLEVSLSEDSRWALLSVKDYGDGIPDDIRTRIFDLYFTTKKGGSGIGLAMTYRILQLHHGQLDVESKVGSGATFTLRLPVSTADQKQRSTLKSETAVISEGLGK
jgi:signal transduction histidine kinase